MICFKNRHQLAPCQLVSGHVISHRNRPGRSILASFLIICPSHTTT
ncbi:hypothetical protein I35_5952 [Burkholderia cenocepacia H111]|nr:hypothetical protein C7S14_0431 [Burkholderia cepacia]CDN63788.1 hypothetical protein I35_5952 [Burkholderia cenocepacia H111]